jgi:hypothetical protein
MATWQSLPPEVRDRILHFFCAGIVTVYQGQSVDFWENDAHKFPILGSWPPNAQWPEPPSCLLSLSSALKTCRYFYNAIKNVLKLEGESTVELL